MSFVFYPGIMIFSLMLILLIIGIVYIVRKSKQVLRRLSNLEKAIYEKDNISSSYPKDVDGNQEGASREDSFAPRKRK
ncbi:hypothetical protein BK131_03905 [Paenibacillus amylolyticus]|uniref:DUF4083 domain-containing protein n=1 Tax=Paenibacillus amylolyticus TaxID=1451 RepID=A0A100VJ91_PAEAM|nr:hypothetical protein [Paenibacillus amylolyticus]OMF17126.1 hypothetical protein BK131_03905 [Paenibacillus amylolyticus]GAS80888.1 unknown protein [Paenibacillus amylolyticus]